MTKNLKRGPAHLSLLAWVACKRAPTIGTHECGNFALSFYLNLHAGATSNAHSNCLICFQKKPIAVKERELQ